MEADDFRQWTANYYSGAVTRLHLWDVTCADLSRITVEDIMVTQNVSGMRKGGKTAFVTPNDLDFGISRMGEMRYEMGIGSIAYQTFRSFDEAKKWLGV
jgi:hypothetical protein